MVEEDLAPPCTSSRETISQSYFSQDSRLGFGSVINWGLKEGRGADLARPQLMQ